MSSDVKLAVKRIIGDLKFKRVIGLASHRNPRYRALRVALRHAYAVCARHYYPKWASYLLDEQFQALGARRLRACYLMGVTCFQPADLAAFWADHMGWFSEEVKQQHITELTPVASRFLSCLEAELCASAEFQARSDCGATSAIHYPAVGNTAAPAFMGAAQPMPR